MISSESVLPSEVELSVPSPESGLWQPISKQVPILTPDDQPPGSFIRLGNTLFAIASRPSKGATMELTLTLLGIEGRVLPIDQRQYITMELERESQQQSSQVLVGTRRRGCVAFF